jgi:hypothetical protein
MLPSLVEARGEVSLSSAFGELDERIPAVVIRQLSDEDRLEPFDEIRPGVPDDGADTTRCGGLDVGRRRHGGWIAALGLDQLRQHQEVGTLLVTNVLEVRLRRAARKGAVGFVLRE